MPNVNMLLSNAMKPQLAVDKNNLGLDLGKACI